MAIHLASRLFDGVSPLVELEYPSEEDREIPDLRETRIQEVSTSSMPSKESWNSLPCEFSVIFVIENGRPRIYVAPATAAALHLVDKMKTGRVNYQSQFSFVCPHTYKIPELFRLHLQSVRLRTVNYRVDLSSECTSEVA